MSACWRVFRLIFCAAIVLAMVHPTVRPASTAASTTDAVANSGPERVTRPEDISIPPAGAAQAEPQAGASDGPTHRSLYLNGTDAYVEVANAPALNPTGAITIEAWVWREDGSRCETVVGKDYHQSYWLGFCPDKIRFYAAGSSTSVDGNTTVPAKEWVHIAVTYDGTTRRYYLNGELDLTSTANNGPLATNSHPVGIGFDIGQIFLQNYFKGYLDEVRIWNVVRTQDEIRAAMYEQIYASPGLVAAWRFNGSGWDARLNHDGADQGGAAYRINGALPRSLIVPRSTTTVAVDGQCSAAEYGTAERIKLDHPFLPTVYLQRSNDDFYICFAALPRGNRGDSYAAVNVDRDLSRDELAQPGDYRFVIGLDGSGGALRGDGSGGYEVLTGVPAGSWQAARSVTEFDWSAEFRLGRALLDVDEGWRDDVGLDLGHYWFNAVGDDYHWPVDGSWNRPDRWARVGFTHLSSGTPPTFNFSGHVHRQRDNGGIANATVQLFVSSLDGTSLVDSDETAADGAFSLSYRGYGPGLFIIQEEDPVGMYSISADGGADGTVINANVIRFPGSDSSRTYGSVTFVDSDARPTARSFDRYYLIVHGDAVQPDDLWPLVEMKKRQGFQVEIASTATISSTVSGRDLAERIRNWLKDRWQRHAPAPVYALLVGRADVIPVRDVGWDSQDLPNRASPRFSPAWPTDWYYADLDSNWDKNNNGFYGEDLNCMWDHNAPCPADRNTLEGAYGGPGSDDDWQAEIAIGRIGVNTAEEVRQALQTSVAFERSGALDKRRGILGGSFWGWDGRSWVETEGGGEYRNPGEEGVNSALYYAWDGEKPYGLDTATHLEEELHPILREYLAETITLYETRSPGDDPALTPTIYTPDVQLSHDNMDDQWRTRRFGLLNLTGHGDQGGIWGLSWINDWNGNRRLENPARPSDCSSPPCWELSGWYSYVDKEVPAPAGLSPIVFANACGTGGISWNKTENPDGSVTTTYGPRAVAGDMQGLGKASGWVGSLAVTPVGGTDATQDVFNRELLSSRLLGDATWKALRTMSLGGQDDARRKTMTLFGDPALSYWGNPVDALAPWPQDGRDWWATSATPFNGPNVGRIAWTTTVNSPQSPPVVDANGNVIVGGVGRVTRFAPNGTKLAEETVDVAPGGLRHTNAPAVTTDGVYVASLRQLYGLESTLVQRTFTPIDGAVRGAPRVGPDGVVWVPTDQGMARITGAGKVALLDAEGVTGPAAYLPSGALVWSTDQDRIKKYSVDRWGVENVSQVSVVGGGDLTPPAGTSQGDILVGTSNGTVLSVAGDTLTERWYQGTGAAIVGKPAIGFDDTVYVGNAAGRVSAFSSSGGLIWQTDLGSPVAATPTVDGNQLFVTAGTRLYALDLATGDVHWSLNLGGGLDGRSTPVIGAGRMLYVTRSDNTLVAVQEDLRLTVPSDVAIIPGIGSLAVNWRDNSSGETGFRVELCTEDGNCGQSIQVGANVTGTAFSQVTSGLPYFVRVQALGADESATTLSAAATAEAIYASEFAASEPAQAQPQLPSAPTGLTAVAQSSTAIQISWNHASSSINAPLGFTVYRATSAGGPYEQVGRAGADERTFLDDGLAVAGTFYYQVEAYNAAGTSARSTAVKGMTKSRDLPAPTKLRASYADGQLRLTWQDNASGESGYVVERSEPGVANYTVIATLSADATSYVDEFDLFGGVFEYRVKAVAAVAESDYAYTTAQVEMTKEYNLYLPIGFR